MLIMPALYVLFFYAFLAVAPALFLLRYIYRQDKIEHEPGWLIRKLIIRGILAGFLSMILETIGENILVLIGLEEGSDLFNIISAFVVVAAAEEGMKYWQMKRLTWKSPEFNYRFDGIVYAVSVSLGFAGMENILYALNYGPSVLLPRAILSIPGHCAFAVIMGLHYGRAREFDSYGEIDNARSALRRAWLLPVFFHGMYDACALTGSGLSMLLFAVVVIVIYITLFKTVRREAGSDAPV